MKTKNPLKYSDERDKSYGVAGMAIAVFAYDSEDALAAVSIDAPDGHSVEFGSEFGFNGNPRLSAKISWTELLKHFRLGTGMLVANAICRHYVQHRRRMPDSVGDALRRALGSSGAADEIQLDTDEVEAVIDSNIRFFDRLFQYQAVHEATHSFADALIDRRRMTAAEVHERLAPILRYF